MFVAGILAMLVIFSLLLAMVSSPPKLGRK
jgi:hypothetical protein